MGKFVEVDDRVLLPTAVQKRERETERERVQVQTIIYPLSSINYPSFMKKKLLFVCCLAFVDAIFAQSVTQKIAKAYKQFESDSQLAHAVSSLYVINAKTGAVVFNKNAQIGLAPASTQKIFTAAAALAL